MEGWYIDYIDKFGHLNSIFMYEPVSDISGLDSKIASARATIFMFDLLHHEDLSEFIGIKRGVINV